MKILLTGGTGVIGEGVIPALLGGEHRIRLLSRGADEDARQWPEGVEAFRADISQPAQLRGAADGCDAVVHIVGIVEEQLPDATFERVNVDGTRNIIEEARRAGVPRFVYISSLGAEHGASEYHQSKRRAEAVVRDFPGDWLIIRPGNVYGPGDEVISALLRMVRALPAVPILDAGDQQFQPIWYCDLGAAIANALPDPAYSRRTLEVAGIEITTTTRLLDQFAEITGRTPVRIPIPSALVSIGTRLADLVGLGAALPMTQATLTMLLEENIIREPSTNALPALLGRSATPLSVGLRELADVGAEQLPSEGVGTLQRKRFWADIEGSKYSPMELMDLFREQCTELMPIDFETEPETPQRVRKGVTLTAALPGRGNIQMRVEESTAQRVTLATLKGHPLAGVVSFSTEEHGRGGRFEVTIHARAASGFDWMALKSVGAPMQDANWQTVVGRVVALSGGANPHGIEQDEVSLDEDASGEVEAWITELILRRKRKENAKAGGKPPRTRGQ